MFHMKTRNTTPQFSKNAITGIDLDSNQTYIIVVMWLLIFYIFIYWEIWFIWKLIMISFLIILSYNFIKKVDDDSINTIQSKYGKTLYTWFQLYIKKTMTWNKSIDKGNDEVYFWLKEEKKVNIYKMKKWLKDNL